MSLKIQNLTKIYQSGEEQITALDDVSFDVQDNAFVSIVGASGSGKSTLLHLIAGLENPTQGRVWLNDLQLETLEDKQLSKVRNEQIGFVFQQFMLLKDFTVLENVMLPYYIMSGDLKQSKAKARLLLEKLNLQNKIKQYPYEISGGEAQRVAIARALINRPLLVLADEPTGNLDEKNQTRVLEILLDMKKETPFMLLLVTHNMEFAKQADRIITLEFGRIKSFVNSPMN